MTKNELNAKSHEELVDLATQLGLESTGNKGDVVNRIYQHLKEHGEELKPKDSADTTSSPNDPPVDETSSVTAEALVDEVAADPTQVSFTPRSGQNLNLGGHFIPGTGRVVAYLSDEYHALRSFVGHYLDMVEHKVEEVVDEVKSHLD